MRTLAQTWAEPPRVQVSLNGISSFRPHHPQLLSLQEITCGLRANLSPSNTSAWWWGGRRLGGRGGGNDDAGSELAELMHAFGVPVRTGDQEVLDIQSECIFFKMKPYLIILDMVEEEQSDGDSGSGQG